MNVFKNIHQLPTFRNAVITIGSFDGVHGGHQKLLEHILQLARKINGESVVITFHPHPRQIVYPKDKSLKLITTIEEKIALFERYGLDNLVIIPFTVAFSQQSADEYIEKFIVQKFNPKYIVIGYDHRFGLNRQGDINYLRFYSKKAGFEVIEIEPQQIEAITISSTKIRKAVEAGNVQKATSLLKHYFILSGKVIHGQKIGKSIGFPTANIEIGTPNKLLPKDGIYAVFVQHDRQQYQGMLYIGNRPTLSDLEQKTIEVNIFDFNKKIYGEDLSLELVEFIREDAKFDDLESLKQQLVKDKANVLAALQKYPQAIPKMTFRYPEVAVVILNYNGEQYLKNFLPSVLLSDYPNLRIIVADNGSTDESLHFLEQSYDGKVEVLDLKKNYGFAGGYNQALRQVHSPYYVLLNSDIEVSKNWIRPIIELMEQESKIGICQPKILAYEQKSSFEYAGAAGGWFDVLGYPFCRGRVLDTCETDNGQYDSNQEVFWASGAALFIKSDLYHDLGGLDAQYFAHMEEIDLCWRAKRAGYQVVACPKSVVYHVGGGTLSYDTPRKTYLNFRNALTTIIKNEPASKLLWLLPFRLILDGLAGFVFLLQGRIRHIWEIFRAHAYLYRNFRNILQRRRIFTNLVKQASIQPEMNKAGILNKSMLWQYYVLRRKTFDKITK